MSMPNFSCPRCGEYDTLLSHYWKDRRGNEYFDGHKCSECGYLLESSLGRVKIRREKKLEEW